MLDHPAEFPNERDVLFYREHGWCITDFILPDWLLTKALRGASRHYAGERDMRLPISRGFLDWKKSDGDVLRLNDYVSLQNRELRELVLYPAIGAIASKLVGGGTVRLFHDQLIYKPPTTIASESIVGWHTDRSYWKTCTSENMLTAWVPLVDVTREMGCLAVIDGSHRWAGNEEMRTFKRQDLDGLRSLIMSSGDAIEEVRLPMRCGQMSFHHAKTIHGSYPNETAEPRIGLAIHIQDQSNRYCPAVDENGNPVLHINDVLCSQVDDLPDYTDPDICPVLYSDDIS